MRKVPTTIATVRRFVERGQAAQAAIDRILDDTQKIRVDDLPPWKRCDEHLNGCPGWTRGAYCPQHREATHSEPSALQGAPDGRRTPPARTVATFGMGDHPVTRRGPPAPGGPQHATKRRR